MEKIYSRKRIKLPVINKIKIILFGIIVFLIIAVIVFIIAIYPIFEGTCKNKAGSVAINVTSNEVHKVMSNYEYEDLVQIEKNINGDITMIRLKIVPINEIISKITSNIKNEIDRRDEVTVELKLGTITGIQFISFIGPKFNISLECSGGVKTNLLSEFSSSRHKSNFT